MLLITNISISIWAHTERLGEHLAQHTGLFAIAMSAASSISRHCRSAGWGAAAPSRRASVRVQAAASNVEFRKYQGLGNDFILVSARLY